MTELVKAADLGLEIANVEVEGLPVTIKYFLPYRIQPIKSLVSGPKAEAEQDRFVAQKWIPSLKQGLFLLWQLIWQFRILNKLNSFIV